MAAIIARLNYVLAPCITRHGVLMEVYGEGILIVGKMTGQEALDSGDQAAVDAAAQQIHSVLTQMRAMNEERLTPHVVEKEVPVEVLPTDDYCNIPGHRVWPIVAVISLAVNLCLLAVIGFYITKKKKTQRDDTPLVDYDIEDDMF